MRAESTPPQAQAADEAASAEQATLRHTVRAYLGMCAVMALSTQGSDGPWTAPVYFAADFSGGEAALYFVSSPRSRHGQHLAVDPRVSAAIYQDEHDWRQIRGVQLEGDGAVVRSPRDLLRAWRVYLAKFPAARDLFKRAKRADPRLAGKILRTRIYRLHVQHLFYVDNRLGFGSRREVLDLASDA